MYIINAYISHMKIKKETQIKLSKQEKMIWNIDQQIKSM